MKCRKYESCPDFVSAFYDDWTGWKEETEEEARAANPYYDDFEEEDRWARFADFDAYTKQYDNPSASGPAAAPILRPLACRPAAGLSPDPPAAAPIPVRPLSPGCWPVARSSGCWPVARSGPAVGPDPPAAVARSRSGRCRPAAGLSPDPPAAGLSPGPAVGPDPRPAVVARPLACRPAAGMNLALMNRRVITGIFNKALELTVAYVLVLALRLIASTALHRPIPAKFPKKLVLLAAGIIVGFWLVRVLCSFL